MNNSIMKFVPIILWSLVAVLLIYMASIDLYDQEQFILAAAALTMIFVLRARYMRTSSNANPLRLTRLILMILAGLMALRYMIWRVQYSIPWYNDTYSLILSLLLVAAEILAIGLYFMGAFSVVNPLNREPVPLDMERDDLPSVDVFVPSYNESSSLLQTTLLAATSLHYPSEKLNVFLLDDGGTVAKCNQPGVVGDQARQRQRSLRQLCEEVGCQYLTRNENLHAKAGNINAALKQTSSEYIAIFDSDHVPTIDFLENTIGTLLEDKQIALLQTPHFMINQDPLEKSLNTEKSLPPEGDMFYSLGLCGMDNWNAGFFCGSGAVVQRKALDDIGGISTDTIVEDADSSMEMLCLGYKTAYLNIPMLAGLSSENIDGLVVQRSRWATGMIQLLRMKNPMTKKGLSFMQRVCYINCISYWFFVLARIVFLMTPVFALFFSVVFFSAPPSEIMLYLIPYLIGLYLVLNVLYGRVRWTFVSDIYDTFSSILLAGTVIRTLINPSHKEFKVTPKEVIQESSSISNLANRFYIVISIQLAASVYGGYILMTDPAMYDQTIVSLAWNVYNMIFTFAALGMLIERGEVRHRPRIAVEELASITLGEQTIPCQIKDMTEHGAKLYLPNWTGSIQEMQGKLKFSAEDKDGELSTILSFVSEISINIRSDYMKEENGQQHLVVGVEFNFHTMQERRMIVNYLYGDSKRWQEDLRLRHEHSTITQGVLFLFKACYYGVVHLGIKARSLTQKNTQVQNLSKQDGGVST